MRVKIWALLLLLLVGQVHFISAENVSMTREETFPFLQEALSAQLSLGDKFRSEKEISDVLSPYFTDEYQNLFVAEHIFSEPEGFIMYGSDVFDYFIPMYSYDENTKIMTAKNKIIVTEYFLPQLEGPVVWDRPHYESLTIIKTNDGWKISEYLISEDKPIME